MRGAGALLLAAAAARGCTYIDIPAPGGVHVISRTMELGVNKESGINMKNIVVHPRGEHMMNRSVCRMAGPSEYGIDNASRWVEWDVRHAYVSVDSGCGGKVPIPYTCDDFAVEGMNEVGLTVAPQVLLQTEWSLTSGPIVGPGKRRAGLCYNDVTDWMLGNFASIDELTEGLRNITVYDPFPPIGQPRSVRAHYAVADATGASVVIEFLNEGVQVHNNTVGIMTNDPDYQWHLRNLNNYVAVSPDWPAAARQVQTEVGPVPYQEGHGYSVLGLPGSYSPPDRFVRSFYLREMAMRNLPLTSVDDAFVLAQALQDSNVIPQGALAQKNTLEGWEVTKWRVVKIPQQRVWYFRTYANVQWKMIDLKRLDMGTKSSMPIEDGTHGVKDVTGAFVAGVPPA